MSVLITLTFSGKHRQVNTSTLSHCLICFMVAGSIVQLVNCLHAGILGLQEAHYFHMPAKQKSDMLRFTINKEERHKTVNNFKKF